MQNLLSYKLGSLFELLKLLIDVSLVWLLIYSLLRLMRRNVRMMLLLKGIGIILIAWIISDLLRLNTLTWMVSYFFQYGILAVIIIFQPELRSALEQIGRNRFFGRHSELTVSERDFVISEIITVVNILSKKRIGALITIEKDVSLFEYISRASKINADVRSELIQTIFTPNTPLHDGAIIIQGKKIVCASAYYPSQVENVISPKLGTRHRAALAISEITDSVTIVVSEETGSTSLSFNGELYYDISINELEKRLRNSINEVIKSTPEKGDE